MDQIQITLERKQYKICFHFTYDDDDDENLHLNPIKSNLFILEARHMDYIVDEKKTIII